MAAAKVVWMVSGNKGGVGKSLFCLALASLLERRKETFSVLDGDGRTGDVFASFRRKYPARQADFRLLRPESHMCAQDGEYEALIRQLLLTSTHLIINTPDGADTLLMKWFDVTLSHTEQNNFQFKFMYLMSDRPDGLELLPELSTRFLALYPMRNLYFGRVDRFATFNLDHAHMFHEVLDFPALRADEVRLLFDAHTYPAEALREKQDGRYRWHTLARARIRQWQARVEETLRNVVGLEDISNIRLDAGG